MISAARESRSLSALTTALAGRCEAVRRDDRRAHELAELAVQAVFDLLLRQHEQPDRDEEARPGAEVDEIGAPIGERERAARDEAQQKWNAPGERDEQRRAPAGKQSVLAQHAQSPLQFEERPAMRGEIVPDPARLLAVGVVDFGDISIRRQFRHSAPPSCAPPLKPSWRRRVRRASSFVRLPGLTPAPPPTAPPPASGTREEP